MALEIKDERKTRFVAVFIIVVVISAGIIILMPFTIIRSEFTQVVRYINIDSRNPHQLTYEQPSLNNSIGWSVVDYKWHKNWLVDWEQVNLFLNEMEYYDEQAYWCEYYRIAPDDYDFPFLIWFQKAETEFVFLYLC
ncbi:MAG: hypothetical protein ACFFDV_08255 [Candidatus Thorarchaeota archaeon]